MAPLRAFVIPTLYVPVLPPPVCACVTAPCVCLRNRPRVRMYMCCRWLQEEARGAAEMEVPLSDSVVQRLQRFGTYGRLKQAALRKVGTWANLGTSACR